MKNQQLLCLRFVAKLSEKLTDMLTAKYLQNKLNLCKAIASVLNHKNVRGV